jgi:SAM-dependent methyltransferase
MLRSMLRAVRHPEAPSARTSILRHVLLKPRVFDLLSCALQLADSRRLARIADDVPADEFYAKVKRYNAGVALKKMVTRTRRAELLYQLLVVPPRDVAREKLLIVGPRNVHELLIAWLYGFRWKNIVGIDLYSTNERILVMNMEEMGFRDGSFDAVVMAQTLPYAREPFRCLSEIARVLIPGGRLAFTSTYCPEGAYPGNHVSGAELARMLEGLALRVRFYDARDKINSDGALQTGHIFVVQKADTTDPGFDRAEWSPLGTRAATVEGSLR